MLRVLLVLLSKLESSCESLYQSQFGELNCLPQSQTRCDFEHAVFGVGSER